MNREEMRQFLRDELPIVIQEYPDVRYMLIGALAETFARQTDVQAILEHLDLLREDFNRQMVEFARRQDMFAEKLDEHFRRVESQLGALDNRWGLQAEDSFRAALAGILDDRLGLRVERFRQIDTEGTVFGQPEQVEIDVVVRDGVCYLLELKSSLSKADVYTFARKVAFYERLKGVTVQRRIVIAPMLRPGVLETAQALGLEVYTSAYDVVA